MKTFLISLLVWIPMAGFSTGLDNIEQENENNSPFSNTIPSELTYRSIRSGMLTWSDQSDQSDLYELYSQSLRSGSVPGSGNSNSGVTPAGEIAYLPILLLLVAYGCYARKRRKEQEQTNRTLV